MYQKLSHLLCFSLLKLVLLRSKESIRKAQNLHHNLYECFWSSYRLTRYSLNIFLYSLHILKACFQGFCIQPHNPHILTGGSYWPHMLQFRGCLTVKLSLCVQQGCIHGILHWSRSVLSSPKLASGPFFTAVSVRFNTEPWIPQSSKAFIKFVILPSVKNQMKILP